MRTSSTRPQSKRLHRETSTLEVRGVWWEPKIKLTRARRARFDEALERLASLVHAERIVR